MATTTPARTATERRAASLPAMPRRTRRHDRNLGGAAAAWIWLAVVLLPVYYVVITSVTTQGSYYTRNPLAPPARPTFESYALVLRSGFGVYFTNSVIVTVVTVAATTAVCLLAAYAIVRSRGWIVRGSYALFLLGLAIPLQATVVPLFFVLGRIGLYDTLAALILPSIAFAIPISVLVLVNFIRDIPRELFQSMHVDGAGQWALLWHLVMPLSRSAMATVAIYDALQVWNGFLLPLVLTQSDDKRVLPLALWNFQGQFSINVPATLAAVVLSAVPILVLYLLARRQFVAGLTAGAGR